MSTGDGERGPFRLVLTLGTDHHPFDRAVRWIDEWVDRQPGPVELLAQVGTGGPSRAGDSHPLLPPGRLAEAMAAADAVVTHGGPGSILDARRAGIEPVVLPRSAVEGEHVDDHQQRFARWMADRGRLLVAGDEAHLGRLLDAAVADRSTYRRAGADTDRADTARRFGELVEGLLG